VIVPSTVGLAVLAAVLAAVLLAVPSAVKVWRQRPSDVLRAD
jgi:hypothetical protein